jgi:DNA-binding winged helix-turn-helix (wHTH) protein
MRYSFGPFTLDAASRRLHRGAAEVPLVGKAFELLLWFVRHPGDALTRAELFDALWPDGEVEDGNLSQNVYLVRRALDPDGSGVPYVETIPRYGYRFCAAVEVEVESAKFAESRRPPARLFYVAVAISICALLALGISFHPGRQAPVSARERDLLALATYHERMRSPQDLQYARTYFEQAAHLDARRPEAYAGLAATYALLAEFAAEDSSPRRRDVALARRNVARALAIDGTSSDALAASGFIAYRFDNDPTRGKTLLLQAVASDPNNAAAHHWLGVLELIEGDGSASLAELETAHRLEPTSEIFLRWLARGYAFSGRPREALRLSAATLGIDPYDEGAMFVRATALEEAGDLRDALVSLRALGRDASERGVTIPDAARIDAILHPDKRNALLAVVDGAVKKGQLDPFESTLFYLTMKRFDRVSELRDKLGTSLMDRGIDAADPRFKRLLALRT